MKLGSLRPIEEVFHRCPELNSVRRDFSSTGSDVLTTRGRLR